MVTKNLRSLIDMTPTNSEKPEVIENITSSSALRELSDTLCDPIRTINLTKVKSAILSTTHKILQE
ncbi:hypothetical protein BGZ76_002904, partial [Entomortierella beljakovae]